MTRRVVLPAAVAAVAAAAGAVVPALASAGAGSPTARAAATTKVVKFGEYFYRPKRVTVKAGGKVRFTNVGKIQHTVADSSKGGDIRSKVIKPRPLSHGKSQTVTFKKPGTVYYLCTFHPTLMKGVVIVTK